MADSLEENFVFSEEDQEDALGEDQAGETSETESESGSEQNEDEETGDDTANTKSPALKKTPKLTPEEIAENKRKRKLKQKEKLQAKKVVKKQKLDEEKDLIRSAWVNTKTTVDVWNEKLKSALQLTELEQEELCLRGLTDVEKESFVHDVSRFEHEHNDKNYALFISTISSKLKEKTPQVLIITQSAIRAVGVIKVIRDLKISGKIGKLFAKHFKVEEQTTFLRKEKVPVAVGTPARLAKLIENGSLSLNKLQTIVVDGTFVDPKERNIFDNPEIRTEFWNLWKTHLVHRVKEEKTKVAVY